MIRSMSGYGRGASEGDGFRISIELRSVNHRFCRVGVHMPAELAFFEAEARQQIGERIERGKVDLSATLGGPERSADTHLNGELAAAYKVALVELAEDLGIEPRVDMSVLLGMPGVVASQSAPQIDPTRDLSVAREALLAALQELDDMRAAEGEHLKADIVARVAIVDGMVARIGEMTLDLPRRYKEQIAARIEALMSDSDAGIDPGRLAQEVAYIADRSDVTEELVRLRSHLEKATSLLERGGSVGRSLEFLLQELHREINTIGAKAKVAEIGDIVVDLKSELERVREQVQNVE